MSVLADLLREKCLCPSQILSQMVVMCRQSSWPVLTLTSLPGSICSNFLPAWCGAHPGPWLLISDRPSDFAAKKSYFLSLCVSILVPVMGSTPKFSLSSFLYSQPSPLPSSNRCRVCRKFRMLCLKHLCLTVLAMKWKSENRAIEIGVWCGITWECDRNC
jgi:hypothetical protein